MVGLIFIYLQDTSGGGKCVVFGFGLLPASRLIVVVPTAPCDPPDQ